MADAISGATSGASAGAALGPWGAAIGGLAGGIGGAIMGGKQRREAERQRRAMLALLEGTDAEAGPSEFGSIAADPALVTAQRSVLERLMREGSTDGLDISERVGLAQAQGEIGRQERGSREAILQSMAARGQGGSGSELAAALTNQQGSADRSAQMGSSAAAAARQRQLAALAQSGEFASGMRGQDFGEKATRAGGMDAANRFNASARLNKAGMQVGVMGGNAAASDAAADRSRFDGMQLGQGVGAGLGYLYGKKKEGQ
jgi:hypothetical protein